MPNFVVNYTKTTWWQSSKFAWNTHGQTSESANQNTLSRVSPGDCLFPFVKEHGFAGVLKAEDVLYEDHTQLWLPEEKSPGEKSPEVYPLRVKTTPITVFLDLEKISRELRWNLLDYHPTQFIYAFEINAVDVHKLLKAYDEYTSRGGW